MKKALLFPGQGSQFVGMGKDLYDNFTEAKEVFKETDDVLNQNLSDIIFKGDIEELTKTSNTQPALTAVSIAVIRVLQKQGKINLKDFVQYGAGHSLGEYSALCAANSISLKDTIKLLRIRGDAMQQAVPQNTGGMAALIGVEFDEAVKICAEFSQYGIIQAANDNGGGQVVVSGQIDAINKIVEEAAKFGVKKAIKLSVSAPFHSKMMQPAADKMQEALGPVAFKKPDFKIISNVTASAEDDPAKIKNLLVTQITDTVRWRESVIFLKERNIELAIECGAGKILGSLVKRIDKSLTAISLQNAQDIEEFLKNL